MVLRTIKKLQFVKLIYILFEVMVPHNYKAGFFFLLLASDFKLFLLYLKIKNRKCTLNIGYE